MPATTANRNLGLVMVATVCGCLGVLSATALLDQASSQLYSSVALQPVAAAATRSVTTPVSRATRLGATRVAAEVQQQLTAEPHGAGPAAPAMPGAAPSAPLASLMGILGFPIAIVALLMRRSPSKAEQHHEGTSFAQQVVGAGAALSLAAAGPATAASVDFGNLKSGATVASPVHVEFTVDGYAVAPASEGLQDKSGHFHLFVDAEESFPEGLPIQFDDSHKHYGKAQTSADIELAPGKHQFALQFANAVHESYGPEMSKAVTFTVK